MIEHFGPVELELFNHKFSAIAEEMGVVLCRSGFSPNIKERQDYSCALFDDQGELVAHAAHIPVHLGSTPLSVRAVIARLPMHPGDIAVVNDPYAGGTHLPDVTAVAPVFIGRNRKPFAYVANRAHHADIGGMTPGSMPLATEIFQEGVRMPPIKLLSGGAIERGVLDLFLANTRVPSEREGDLMAQVAALRVGSVRVRELIEHHGRETVKTAMKELKSYSARLMHATIRSLRPGVHRAFDVLDDDGFGHRDIRIQLALTVRGGRARLDFSGTSPQVSGGLNANLPVTLSAVFYVFRSLATTAIPANEGLMRPIEVHAPEGTVVNARFPAAVAGGNVETSQRIVDVLLRALAPAAGDRIPAASQGTMNNIAIGGEDVSRNRPFSYYETIGGGAGGAADGHGASALHTHMTNTLNTPIEGLEAYYPLRVTRYGRRWGSGGAGVHRGGDGIVRELQFLSDAQVTLLTERRRRAPYGMKGGKSGRPGTNTLIRRRQQRRLPGKVSFWAQTGDRLSIETPGGGGWGAREKPARKKSGREKRNGQGGAPRPRRPRPAAPD